MAGDARVIDADELERQAVAIAKFIGVGAGVSRLAGLTRKEQECVDLVRAGHSLPQIAVRLGKSYGAVSGLLNTARNKGALI